VRLQTLAPPPEQIILGDEKRVEVETYTRYRIANPLRFIRRCAPRIRRGCN
jgi:membrane protease subunit HflC